MKKIIAICLMAIIGVMSAQEVDLKKKNLRREGFGGFGVGSIYQNMGNLNDRLAANGYQKIDSYFTTIGGGGYGYIGDKILIGGSGFGGVGNTSESDSAQAEISMGGGFFEMGYIAYEDSRFRIWPMAGIGGTGTSISINPKNSTPEFDELLQNPKSSVNFASGNLSLKLALNADAVFKIEKDEGTTTIAASLQGGMIYEASRSLWTMGNGSEILNGPDMPREKFFLGVNIYFGGSENRSAE